MGEKIKDIGELRLGDAEFAVELNHGYTSKNKYSIHIQNEKMRLALNDDDFLKLCGLILRAESELKYLKAQGNNDAGDNNG